MPGVISGANSFSSISRYSTVQYSIARRKIVGSKIPSEKRRFANDLGVSSGLQLTVLENAILTLPRRIESVETASRVFIGRRTYERSAGAKLIHREQFKSECIALFVRCSASLA